MNYRRNKALALSLVLGALVAASTQSHAMFKAFAAAAARISTHKWTRPIVALSAGSVMLQGTLHEDLAKQNKMFTSEAHNYWETVGRTNVILKTIAKINYELSKNNTYCYGKSTYQPTNLWGYAEGNSSLRLSGPYNINGIQHTLVREEQGDPNPKGMTFEPSDDDPNTKLNIDTYFDLDSTHPIAEEIRMNLADPKTRNDQYTKCKKVKSSDKTRKVHCYTKSLPITLFNEKMTQYIKEFQEADAVKLETVKEPNEK